MDNWSDGYITEIPYEWYFFHEMAPAHLNFICLLKGHRPPALGRPFTYCELGAGLGLTTTMLAASNPTSEFWAVDVNPTHIVSAKALAEEGGVKNVNFVEASFHELLQQDPPEFDYICLHGVWSWVSAENRTYIRDIIRARLKPGGVVYLSYNCAVGWEVVRSLGRLLRTFVRMEQGSIENRLSRAIDRLTALAQQPGGFFQDNPIAHNWLERIKTYSWNYLAHEYLNEHWEAFYFEDVMHALAEAKLTFVGASNPLKNFDFYVLKEGSKKLAEEIAHPVMVETLKDFDTTASLRKDVFIRGSQTWGIEQSFAVLKQQRFAPVSPADAPGGKLMTSLGETTISDELLLPILKALGERPCSLDELSALFEEEQFTFFDVLLACAVLADGYYIAPLPHFGDERASETALALNRAIVQRTLEGSPIRFLAAPFIGSGVPSGDWERYCYHFIDPVARAGGTLDGKTLHRQVYAKLTQDGRQLHDENGALLAEEALAKMADDFVAKRLAVWRSLGVI